MLCITLFKSVEDQATKAANEKNKENRHDNGEEVLLYSDEYYAAQKAKRQGLGLIKFVKSDGTKSQPNYSFVNSPSNSFEKSHKISKYTSLPFQQSLAMLNVIFSRLTSDSNHPPSWLYKKPLKLTSFLSSKTLISPPSTLSVSLSNLKI